MGEDCLEELLVENMYRLLTYDIDLALDILVTRYKVMQ